MAAEQGMHAAERAHRLPQVVAILGISAVVAAASVSDLAMAAGLAALAFIVGAPGASWYLVGYLALLIGLNTPLSEHPIHLGAFKLYAADLIIPFLAWGGLSLAWTMLRKRTLAVLPKAEWVLIGLLLLYCGYGLVQIGYGLFAKHYPYDEVFGGYRRMFFYLTAFLAPLLLPLKAHHLRALGPALVGGGLLLVLVGLFRFATGTTARLDVDEATGHVVERMMSTSEYICGACVLAYLAVVVWQRGRAVRRLGALALGGACAGLMLLSGFRLGIVYAALAPVLALVVYTWVRRQPMRRLAVQLTVLALAASAVLAGLTQVFHDQYENMVKDMRVRMLDEQVTGSFRTWAWGGALQHLEDDPLLGAGLGHDLVFRSRARDGLFALRRSSAHSTAVTVLYQTGVVGIALFALFHGAFGVYFLQRARKVPPQHAALVTGLFVGAVCMLGGGFVQPLHVAGYTANYLVMGFTVRLMRPEAGSTAGDELPAPCHE